jgi:hypothetical protein
MPQAKGRWNVSPEIGDNHLLVYDIRPRAGSIGGQGDIHDAIREPICGSDFVKDKVCEGESLTEITVTFSGRGSGLSAVTAPISFGSGTRRSLPLCL